MEKRFEESFNDLSTIYESYFIARKAGGQKDAVPGQPSYEKGAFSTPQGSVNVYQKNLTSAQGPISDEENDPVINKLEELMKEADDEGMDYAVLALGKLKKFIEELKD